VLTFGLLARTDQGSIERAKARLQLATLVLGCLIVLTVVGVVVKLVLDDIGRGDKCPYCSASLAHKVTICPHGHKALRKR
jgi:hypothetical protein